MNTLIIALVLLAGIPLMRWLDRQRGTSKDTEIIPKLPAFLGMGYLCAIYTGHWLDWQTAIIMAGVWSGHSIGFGQPLGYALTGVSTATDPDSPPGAKYESWQVGDLLRQNPWVALTVRGLFVGAAVAVVQAAALIAAPQGWISAIDWSASIKIATAFGAAFPLASYIVRYRLKMPTRTEQESGAAWARQEEVRGGLIGLILFILWWVT